MFSHSRCDPVSPGFLLLQRRFAHHYCQILQASPSLVADMKYEEVYNASMPVLSRDGPRVTKQTSFIGRIAKKVHEYAPTFTHEDVREVAAFSGLSQVSVDTLLAERAETECR